MIHHFLLVSMVGTVLTQKCNPGSLRLPDHKQCATIQHAENGGNGYVNAETKCRNLSGHLLSVHDEKTNSLVDAYAEGLGVSSSLYIGGDRIGRGLWAWTDKTFMEYINWAPGHPNSDGDCLSLNLSDEYWYVTDCQRNLSFVCGFPASANPVTAAPITTMAQNTTATKPSNSSYPATITTSITPTPTPRLLTCSPGWVLHDGGCYNFFTGSLLCTNWEDAMKYCKDRRAHLASIRSAEDNAFVAEHMFNNGTWLGLQWDGTFSWSDGSPVTFTNGVFPTEGWGVYTIHKNGSWIKSSGCSPYPLCRRNYLWNEVERH